MIRKLALVLVLQPEIMDVATPRVCSIRTSGLAPKAEEITAFFLESRIRRHERKMLRVDYMQLEIFGKSSGNPPYRRHRLSRSGDFRRVPSDPWRIKAFAHSTAWASDPPTGPDAGAGATLRATCGSGFQPRGTRPRT